MSRLVKKMTSQDLEMSARVFHVVFGSNLASLNIGLFYFTCYQKMT